MKRRAFLQILGIGSAVAAAPVAAKAIVKSTPPKCNFDSVWDSRGPDGFGLAPVKAEGGIIELDGSQGIITRGSFPKTLWPGARKWYGKTYTEYVRTLR